MEHKWMQALRVGDTHHGLELVGINKVSESASLKSLVFKWANETSADVLLRFGDPSRAMTVSPGCSLTLEIGTELMERLGEVPLQDIPLHLANPEQSHLCIKRGDKSFFWALILAPYLEYRLRTEDDNGV